eukprot:403346993
MEKQLQNSKIQVKIESIYPDDEESGDDPDVIIEESLDLLKYKYSKYGQTIKEETGGESTQIIPKQAEQFIAKVMKIAGFVIECTTEDQEEVTIKEIVIKIGNLSREFATQKNLEFLTIQQICALIATFIKRGEGEYEVLNTNEESEQDEDTQNDEEEESQESLQEQQDAFKVKNGQIQNQAYKSQQVQDSNQNQTENVEAAYHLTEIRAQTLTQNTDDKIRHNAQKQSDHYFNFEEQKRQQYDAHLKQSSNNQTNETGIKLPILKPIFNYLPEYETLDEQKHSNELYIGGNQMHHSGVYEMISYHRELQDTHKTIKKALIQSVRGVIYENKYEREENEVKILNSNTTANGNQQSKVWNKAVYQVLGPDEEGGFKEIYRSTDEFCLVDRLMPRFQKIGENGMDTDSDSDNDESNNNKSKNIRQIEQNEVYFKNIPAVVNQIDSELSDKELNIDKTCELDQINIIQKLAPIYEQLQEYQKEQIIEFDEIQDSEENFEDYQLDVQEPIKRAYTLDLQQKSIDLPSRYLQLRQQTEFTKSKDNENIKIKQKNRFRYDEDSELRQNFKIIVNEDNSDQLVKENNQQKEIQITKRESIKHLRLSKSFNDLKNNIKSEGNQIINSRGGGNMNFDTPLRDRSLDMMHLENQTQNDLSNIDETESSLLDELNDQFTHEEQIILAEESMREMFIKFSKSCSTVAGHKQTFDKIGESYQSLQLKDFFKILKQYGVEMSRQKVQFLFKKYSPNGSRNNQQQSLNQEQKYDTGHISKKIYKQFNCYPVSRLLDQPVNFQQDQYLMLPTVGLNNNLTTNMPSSRSNISGQYVKSNRTPSKSPYRDKYEQQSQYNTIKTRAKSSNKNQLEITNISDQISNQEQIRAQNTVKLKKMLQRLMPQKYVKLLPDNTNLQNNLSIMSTMTPSIIRPYQQNTIGSIGQQNNNYSTLTAKKDSNNKLMLNYEAFKDDDMISDTYARLQSRENS